MRLLRNNGPGDQYLLQTGLAGTAGRRSRAHTPRTWRMFTSDFTGFVLQPGHR